ncbi:MAG: Atg14 domain-containing protein [Actinomycetota bacterium]|nr:Atg14 domain-containing protein [Actinomycetota bacterium]
MSEDREGIRDRVQSRGEKAAADIAQALIGSPAFGQAVSAAVAAKDKANEAQKAAMGALNVSSQDSAERLERRIRVLSDRLEESEDRLDRALDEIRVLKKSLKDVESAQDSIKAPLVSSTTGRRPTSKNKPTKS